MISGYNYSDDENDEGSYSHNYDDDSVEHTLAG